ncbi:sugar phosphate isomerase/epimerase [Natronospirillum operosum]|uniref:Sugar phosphate isomerase/epimerase n=1 Tax=Natronospirillum operosum TaxID=2759953 RepID=A0A4Z0WG79_9GAMM|nr:sugar phosphate isomerase/epimerase family protein [Natronospirillum operosum]TGG93578.1 sugar phosphate isomerase/epimerase [Natronospirillum operosum]
MKAQPLTDFQRLSINDATTKIQLTLEEEIRLYAEMGIQGISIWRDKLAQCGVDRAAKLLDEYRMTVTGLCRGGMFPAATAQGRQEAIEDNRRAIEEAAAIKAQCLVLVVGGMPEGSKDIAGARQMVLDGLHSIIEYARSLQVPLAIEPLHPMYAADRACVNTMAQANDLCDEVGEGIGIALDVYHVWWDPDLRHQIQRAGKARLLGFHICDWLVPTQDMLLDRGMMGDGVIDIPQIRGWVEAEGYTGFHEVEIFSAENWWQKPAEEVLTVCKERYLKVV